MAAELHTIAKIACVIDRIIAKMSAEWKSDQALTGLPLKNSVMNNDPKSTGTSVPVDFLWIHSPNRGLPAD